MNTLPPRYAYTPVLAEEPCLPDSRRVRGVERCIDQNPRPQAQMAELKRTPLHASHVAAGAKMVDFGGWHMPVQYEGILAEHRAVREHVGIFDVSHMGEIDFRGSGAKDAVQSLVTNDVSRLTNNKALYTAVCYPDGGIVDDCIVYQLAEDHLRIVVNASNIEKDEAFFREHAKVPCEIQNRSDEFALIAVQGHRDRKSVV